MKTNSRIVIPALITAAMVGISLPKFVFSQSTGPKSAPKAQAAAEKSANQFLRLKRDGDRLESLQTAITRYSRRNSKSRVTVDLIGAVHIGETDYYNNLNELFTDYDVVLYELVAEQGTRIARGGERRSANPISFVQTSMQNFVGLESQLRLIDYTKKNLVHADLSPQQLRQKMDQRGQTTLSLVMGAFSEMMNDPELQSKLQQQGMGELTFQDLSQMMTDPLKAKRFLAKQFGASGMMEAGLGQSLNQLIVTDRNAAAMKVLDDQVADGKRKVAIFYGAAHMPDFEKRLLADGYSLQAQSWMTAWDLTQSKAAKRDSPMSMLMQMLNDRDH